MSSLNDTPSGERVHIGFFGRRNAGKSSVVNAVTHQDLAVVSDTAGTTTDPVYKNMELLPLGPVTIIDTPGFDDEGALGELRVRKTRQVLNKTDIAVLVVDATTPFAACDRALMELFQEKELPYLIVWNKADLLGSADVAALCSGTGVPAENAILVSAESGTHIDVLKERLARLRPTGTNRPLVSDLLQPGDTAVLVVPIDSAAPKGRLILPQQQVIRDVLEADAIAAVVKENGLAAALKGLKERPRIVITDSQVFKNVAQIVPQEVPLTSFSILMARYKGFLEAAVRGVNMLEHLHDGDTVLISEGCTHHRQCNDIGTVKLPRWLHAYTHADISIETSSGHGWPDDLSPYRMVIHCGGCMLNERELRYRMKCAADQNVPFTNYGTAIAYMNGILPRTLTPIPGMREMLEK